jgi:hypothetical protein
MISLVFGARLVLAAHRSRDVLGKVSSLGYNWLLCVMEFKHDVEPEISRPELVNSDGALEMKRADNLLDERKDRRVREYDID